MGCEDQSEGRELYCSMSALVGLEVRNWFPRSEDLVCSAGGRNDANAERVSRHDRTNMVQRRGGCLGQSPRQTEVRRANAGIKQRRPTTGERRVNARKQRSAGGKAITPCHR